MAATYVPLEHSVHTDKNPREALLQDCDHPFLPAEADIDLQHDLLCGQVQGEWKTRAPSPEPLPPDSPEQLPSDSEPVTPPRPHRKRARADATCMRCGEIGHWAEDCLATPGKCLRCGETGHWARACTRMKCGNCKELDHYAADCPKPAPCFNCGKLGHWAKICPLSNLPEKVELRWVFHGRPPVCEPQEPLEQHHCSEHDQWRGQCCSFITEQSKPHGLMPAHKWRVDAAAPHQMSSDHWCRGGGKRPGSFTLIRFNG